LHTPSKSTNGTEEIGNSAKEAHKTPVAIDNCSIIQALLIRNTGEQVAPSVRQTSSQPADVVSTAQFTPANQNKMAFATTFKESEFVYNLNLDEKMKEKQQRRANLGKMKQQAVPVPVPFCEWKQ
jgi:hypothetical protein